MPTHRRMLNAALNQVIEAQATLTRAIRFAQLRANEAIHEGRFSREEVVDVFADLQLALTAQREATRLTQVAEFQLRVALAMLNEGLTVAHFKEASELGVRLVIVEPDPALALPSEAA